LAHDDASRIDELLPHRWKPTTEGHRAASACRCKRRPAAPINWRATSRKSLTNQVPAAVAHVNNVDSIRDTRFVVDVMVSMNQR
jgi:hypothetical protein